MQTQYRFKSYVRCKSNGKQNVYESNEIIISVVSIPSRRKKSKKPNCKQADWCSLCSALCGAPFCNCFKKQCKPSKRKK